jgi:hypothetical protein
MRGRFCGQRNDFKALPHPNPLPMGEGTETQGERELACACFNSIINSHKLSFAFNQIYSGQ